LRPGSARTEEAKEPPVIGDDVEIDAKAIASELDQRERNLFTISPEDTALLKGLLSVLKVPYLEATDEAEALACDLVRRGLAHAVFSLDSDCLAHLAPTIINDVDLGTGKCQVLYRDEVLEELDLTPEQFQLFCVLCGTDYNRHVRNIAGIGPVNALQLARSLGSIDALKSSGKLRPKDREKPVDLRYERNVELFNLTYPAVTSVPWWDLRVDFDAVAAFAREHHLSCDIGLMRRLWKPPELVFEEMSTSAEERE
jgi:5'-3' exonuclease